MFVKSFKICRILYEVDMGSKILFGDKNMSIVKLKFYWANIWEIIPFGRSFLILDIIPNFEFLKSKLDLEF